MFQRFALTVLLLVAIPGVLVAQDFGVLESAETINRGNIKLGAFPVFVLQDTIDGIDLDAETAIGFVAGYGFSDSFDVEGRVAIYDNITFFGADAEYWVMKNRPLDLSLRGGFHIGAGSDEAGVADQSGVDFSVIGSAPVTPRLEVFGALDFAVNRFDLPQGLNIDDDFTTMHLVPGIEFGISPNLDVLGEIGVGLNDDSSNYVAIGIAYYVR
jgi:hypothetical protein